MGTNPQLGRGIHTFEKIIERNMVYVDKTAFLADMLDGNADTWFLARPRSFGKSVTVSTLKSIFSGEKKAFQRTRH
jgi:hypothetical protein